MLPIRPRKWYLNSNKSSIIIIYLIRIQQELETNQHYSTYSQSTNTIYKHGTTILFFFVFQIQNGHDTANKKNQTHTKLPIDILDFESHFE